MKALVKKDKYLFKNPHTFILLLNYIKVELPHSETL